MSVSDVQSITQLARLGFNHPSVVLTADVFHFFIKNAHEVTDDAQPFRHTRILVYSGVYNTLGTRNKPTCSIWKYNSVGNH